MNGSVPSRQSTGRRLHGRITKEDIRSAGLRRWDGRKRVTTDWFNLYQEPELCFPTGDVLIYLRQPGQSSRPPAFRVHSSVLETRGIHSLLDSRVIRPSLHAPRECLIRSCPGCEKHTSIAEIYIPAPTGADLDAVFDHHITTRNFFAWLYDLPLAGRTLGLSYIALKDRIDSYRHDGGTLTNKKEIIAFAESQNYLDFRECIDHALAAICLAEKLEQEDMWVDAFAHVVGMSHRSVRSSLEFAHVNPKAQALIIEARLEMDVRLARASISIETFFGDDLSGNFLGLSQAARDHFDRFRSVLHAFYIDKYGFWPPAGFSNEQSRYSIYAALYADFRDLYHHLVDPASSINAPQNLTASGGICTLQNVQMFDSKHGFDTLPRPLPRLPIEPSLEYKTLSQPRTRSWNPVTQRKIERENRKVLRKQALVVASNRDVTIMNQPLVRRYSEFELGSTADDLEQITWIEARKIRWILIYAILQTLVSIMAAPKHVRNTQGLSYSLCCHVPTDMPWESEQSRLRKVKSKHEIVPDISYVQSNASHSNLSSRRGSIVDSRKNRRQTLPANASSSSLRSSSLPRGASLRRLLSRKNSDITLKPPVPALPSNAFCEILVHGYGNGLNEVDSDNHVNITTLPTEKQLKRRSLLAPNTVPHGDLFKRSSEQDRMPHDGDENQPMPGNNSISVSRESSNASTTSTKTKSDDELQTPTELRQFAYLSVDGPDKRSSVATRTTISEDDDYHYDGGETLSGSIHINTRTWDEILYQM